MKVRAISIIVAGLTASGLAQPALAMAWNSVNDPLVAYDDGVAQAQAYGNFHNGGGQIAQSESYQRDPRRGGDPVYVETEFYWYGPDHSCGGGGGGQWASCYWADSQKQTPRSDTSSWEWHWRGRDLRADATDARGAIKTCEDQHLSPDPCSTQVIRTFEY